MKVEIVSPIDNDIPVSEMKIGEVGIITRWPWNEYLGLILTKCNENFLVAIASNAYWDNCNGLTGACRVKLLPEGTILKLVKDDDE
jgi:hypothetical protein